MERPRHIISGAVPIAPGSRIGPYEVIARLGEGGMGVVYRGRDARLQRDVALKLLPEHFANDAERLPRFEREAQVLASLNHSNIAQIYGLEQVNGAAVLAKIVASPPDLELLPASTPASIRLLLSSALNKNSAQRLQHIGDTRLFLEGPLAAPTATAAAAPASRGFRRTWLVAALAIAAAGAGFLAALALRQRPEV